MSTLLKPLLALLLTAFSTLACAQPVADDTPVNGYAGAFSARHVRAMQRQQVAIGQRVRENLRIANDRNEVQYAENRRRCQAALRVAELCGTYAGMFYCDAKGFQPIVADPAIKPVVLDNNARYKMERCALDAAKQE